MRKYVLLVIAFILGIKYGIGYILSPKFQAYADKTKAPWTCELDNFLGNLLIVMSRYEEAITRFTATINRCPETASSEVAEYKVAECLADLGRNHDAESAYRAFAVKYSGTKRARIADKAADLLHIP